jgi:hypothetical protein
MIDLPEMAWRRSSLCNTNSCVEIAFLDSYIAMRDTKQPAKPPLLFTKVEWKSFILGAKGNEFNMLNNGTIE